MDKPLWGLRVLKFDGAIARGFLSLTAALPLRVVVGALMGASINAALRQQEKPYNRPDGRGNAIPLWWLAPPRCPVGSMSLDSRVAGLPYESSSFATPASGGTMGA